MLKPLRAITLGRIGIRNSSWSSKVNQVNKKFNKIGDENSNESKKTLKVIRATGGISIIVVLCLLLWASSYSDIPITKDFASDLSKDVRKD